MGIEIERRFLVTGDAWRGGVRRSRRLVQGYLAREGGVTVRLRLEDGTARLTVKGPGGLVRPEFDFPVPTAEAREMIATLCAGRSLSKTRHDVPLDGLVWEVDVFEAALTGLVIAEVELPHPAHALRIPAWAAREVTDDPRYANSALASASVLPEG